MTAAADRQPAPDGRTIAEVLAAARRQLLRVSPLEAAAEQRSGALLVDIRADAQRRIEGEIRGSLVLERNVLEWRLDPRSDARIAEAGGHGAGLVVFCSKGGAGPLQAI